MIGIIICLFVPNALGKEVLTALYVPYDGNVTDCYLQELMHTSEVQWAFRAYHERIVAHVYDDSTGIFYHCLPPWWRALPAGNPVVTKAKYHDSMRF